MEMEWTYAISTNDQGEVALALVTVDHWDTENCLSDGYTDEELEDILPVIEKLGIYEVAESCFMCEEYDAEMLEELLLIEGLIKRTDFEAFMFDR